MVLPGGQIRDLVLLVPGLRWLPVGLLIPVTLLLLAERRLSLARVRASLIFANSIVSQSAGALGLVVLTAVAAHAGVATALLTGAVVLAAAAPLYLVAHLPAATSVAT